MFFLSGISMKHQHFDRYFLKICLGELSNKLYSRTQTHFLTKRAQQNGAWREPAAWLPPPIMKYSAVMQSYSRTKTHFLTKRVQRSGTWREPAVGLPPPIMKYSAVMQPYSRTQTHFLTKRVQQSGAWREPAAGLPRYCFIGRIMRTVVPCPSSLRMSSLPPCMVTISSATARPMPEPRRV